MDISDPTSIHVAGSYDFNADLTSGTSPSIDSDASFALNGNFVYVVSQTACALAVIDISTPTAPTKKYVIEDTGNFCKYGIAVEGDYAYLTDGTSLVVVEAATGAIEATLAVGGSNVQVVNSNYLVTAGSGAINVVNIADPPNAALEQTFDVLNQYTVDPWATRISGNYLYGVSSTDSTLFVVDVSDLENPSLKVDIKRANVGGMHWITESGSRPGCKGVAISGNLVFAACPESPRGSLTYDGGFSMWQSSSDAVPPRTDYSWAIKYA